MPRAGASLHPGESRQTLPSLSCFCRAFCHHNGKVTVVVASNLPRSRSESGQSEEEMTLSPKTVVPFTVPAVTFREEDVSPLILAWLNLRPAKC